MNTLDTLYMIGSLAGFITMALSCYSGIMAKVHGERATVIRSLVIGIMGCLVFITCVCLRSENYHTSFDNAEMVYLDGEEVDKDTINIDMYRHSFSEDGKVLYLTRK